MPEAGIHKIIAEVAGKGNVNSVTDAGVGAQMAFSGIIGANLNVLINLPQIEDQKFKEEMKAACRKLEADGRQLLDNTLALVHEKIDAM